MPVFSMRILMVLAGLFGLGLPLPASAQEILIQPQSTLFYGAERDLETLRRAQNCEWKTENGEVSVKSLSPEEKIFLIADASKVKKICSGQIVCRLPATDKLPEIRFESEKSLLCGMREESCDDAYKCFEQALSDRVALAKILDRSNATVEVPKTKIPADGTGGSQSYSEGGVN